MILRCMQALVRVQARVRARRVRMSLKGQVVQKMLDERQAEEGWCDSKGTLEDVRANFKNEARRSIQERVLA